MPARLVRYRGNELDQQFILQEIVTTVGRHVANLIQLTDKKVSKKHAVIRDKGSGVFELEDLGSRNGVFVNGKQVKKKAKLKNNDEVKFGDTAFTFEFSAHADGWSQAHVIDASANASDVTIQSFNVQKKKRGLFGLGK